LVMLMGVATKNSILLVEYAIEARRGREATETQPAVPPMSRIDALLDACHKRARPIVMTTIAMGAGMLPIAMSWGSADGSFRSPMAVAVIGGLITSTFLSLLVIPAVFTLVDDIPGALKWVWRKVTFSKFSADEKLNIAIK
jgi:multidrug efflux pump subunit AcrB